MPNLQLHARKRLLDLLVLPLKASIIAYYPVCCVKLQIDGNRDVFNGSDVLPDGHADLLSRDRKL